VITVTYVLMLGSIGSYMFYDSVRGLRRGPSVETPRGKPSVYARAVGALPWKMDFRRSGIRLSVLMPLGLGAMVGILAAIMGVGGGFIMVPVMVYLLRMPMHVVVGTSLFQILFTCTNVTVMQAWMNRTVDFVLALLLLVGSTIGAQIGARLNRKLKADQLKILMSIIVLAVMVKMLLGLLIAPGIMVSYAGGH
jgi:uncharacterized membrane protein YfcA